MPLRIEPIPWAKVDWQALEAAPDRNLFQTRAWLEFIRETKAAEPVIGVLRDGSDDLGYFSGLVSSTLGLRSLGSPLPGWTTPYMGFNLQPRVEARSAAEALVAFAFKELGCVHLELRDRRLTAADVIGLGFTRRDDPGFDERTFEVDLDQSEEALFNGMTSACRRAIRKAEKQGVVVEEAHDEAFADELYEQLTEVFSRQNLVPTYDVGRVRALIRALAPTESLLLLRARDATGRCIATGIFPGHNDTAYFWAGASWRAHVGSRPNEALHWHAMRYWKRRGLSRYDLGGFMEYKRKYGGEEVVIPGFHRSRFPPIKVARVLVPKAMRARQEVLGRLRRPGGHAAGHGDKLGESGP